MASSKVMVTICGTLKQSVPPGQRSPGTSVPDSEQKQSGSRQIDLSQGGARFGSFSMSEEKKLQICNLSKTKNLPQEDSSDPSLQSGVPSQKRSLRTQTTVDCSPQASSPLSHSSSELLILGRAFLVCVFLSQLSTNCRQLQLCFSTSKARPGGHRMACRP